MFLNTPKAEMAWNQRDSEILTKYRVCFIFPKTTVLGNFTLVMGVLLHKINNIKTDIKS